MSERTRAVLVEVAAERERQNAKFGEQNHPDFRKGYPHLTAAHMEAVAKVGLAAQFATGNGDWASILAEEFAEAVASGPAGAAALRAELIQVAAVAVAWVECIDRREGR